MPTQYCSPGRLNWKLSQNVWKIGHQMNVRKNAMLPKSTTRASPLRGSQASACMVTPWRGEG